MTTMTRGSALTVTSQWTAFSGGPNNDLATLSLTITSVDGVVVYLPGTSTGFAHPATGVYSYTWAPDTPPPPGQILVTWVGTTTANAPVSSSELVTVVGAPTGSPTPTGIEALLDDRLYVSRYSTQQVGFTAVVGGIPTDVDGDAVSCQMVDASTGVVVLSRSADHIDTGVYGVTLSGVDSAVIGIYDLRFTYTLSGTQDLNVVAIQVGPAYPAYDALDPVYRQMVENVWQRFGDLFDSPLGGPYLQTQLQAKFNRNRLAQLARVGVGRLNTIAQPHQTYTLDDANNPFPVVKWGPLLEQMTYVEVIKHLIRSYVEQPQVNLSASVSRLDRRDYMSRWQEVLAVEMADLNRMIDNFKIANMGLGQSAVLISGGAYGNFGPAVSYGGAGQAAARGYFPIRFY